MTDLVAQRRAGIEAMHETFGDLFFRLEPEASRDMMVFCVDNGEDTDPNIILQAACFDASWEIVGEPVTRMVACLPDLGFT